MFISRRFLSNTSGSNPNLKKLFQNAAQALQLPAEKVAIKKEVSNETKLKLYALFKQAETGVCVGSRPGIFDPVGRAKYDAWKSLETMPSEVAMKSYIDIITNDIFDGKLPEVSSGDIAEEKKIAVPAPESTNGIQFSIRKFDDIIGKKLNPQDLFNSLTTLAYKLESNGVATLSLNRPKKGNSFNIPMWEELRQAWDLISDDKGVKVVIVNGNGGNFSTGMDLSVFVEFQKLLTKESCDGRKREAVHRFIEYLQSSISKPESCPVPVISAISGHCIGGAVDFITATDLRYCTKNAVFSIKETDLAIVADIGTLQRLPKIIGLQKAAELTYTARNFSGAEAESMGLVVKAFDTEEEMMKHVREVAQQISEKSPLTIRGVKQTLLHTRDHSVRDSLNQVKLWNSAFLLSNDLAEAATAIMTKTKPNFKDA